MTPVRCPFGGCARWAGHPGPCVPGGLVPPAPPVRLEADECFHRRDGTCGRVGHPTIRSACNQEKHRG